MGRALFYLDATQPITTGPRSIRPMLAVLNEDVQKSGRVIFRYILSICPSYGNVIWLIPGLTSSGPIGQVSEHRVWRYLNIYLR